MILTGKKIIEEVGNGRIDIRPFDKGCVTTNSCDLTLGDTLIRYIDAVLDPKKQNAYEKVAIGPEGFLIEQGQFFLGSSREIVGSDHYVPIIHARSGTARMGLFVHCTADLIDIGSHGNVTFQLYATLPVRVYPGMPLAQVTFWTPTGDINLYQGKYQGSTGPQASKMWKDF